MKNGKVILKTYNNIYFKSSILEYKFCSSFSKTILSQLFIFNLHIFLFQLSNVFYIIIIKKYYFISMQTDYFDTNLYLLISQIQLKTIIQFN